MIVKMPPDVSPILRQNPMHRWSTLISCPPRRLWRIPQPSSMNFPAVDTIWRYLLRGSPATFLTFHKTRGFQYIYIYFIIEHQPVMIFTSVLPCCLSFSRDVAVNQPAIDDFPSIFPWLIPSIYRCSHSVAVDPVNPGVECVWVWQMSRVRARRRRTLKIRRVFFLPWKLTVRVMENHGTSSIFPIEIFEIYWNDVEQMKTDWNDWIFQR